jgi:hypothetical protein
MTGSITPTLLAKHHLPKILNNGPLDIRHIIGYLTISIPEFSSIQPAKARRLVVEALEGCGGGDRSGLKRDVKFEKVGWERWGRENERASSRSGDYIWYMYKYLFTIVLY